MKSKLNGIKAFYCGTSNIVLPVPNKAFYPKEFQNKSRLNYYSSLLNTVEINSTFYKLPRPGTVAKWTMDVPDDFRFSFKLSRTITHAKGLNYDTEDIAQFLNTVETAGTKLGCLLVQFPKSVKISFYKRVEYLLEMLVRTSGIKDIPLAIEFRDRSWYTDEVYQMLEQFGAAIVIHDMPDSSTPPIDMERNFYYIRFHGLEGNYRGNYPDDFLTEQANTIQGLVKEGLPVYTYFNNTIGDAIQNALKLDRYVRNEMK